MHKKGIGSSMLKSGKWWKDTIVFTVLAGIVYFAMCFFEKEYAVQGQNSVVIEVCYLALICLVLLFLIHLFYPGAFRRRLAMIVTAIVNRNRETISPNEIAEELGADSSSLDKNLARVSNAELTTKACTRNKATNSDLPSKLLKKIDPNVSSLEEFFKKISDVGPSRYYPIIRKLILSEKDKLSDMYRAIYEFVAELVAEVGHSVFDKDEHEFRKENLKCLIETKGISNKWPFYCAFMEVFYRDGEYDLIIEKSQAILSDIETSNHRGIECRAFVCIMLGSIYMERKQYNYAIPYLEEVARTSSNPVPALFRLAHLYADVLHNYKLGLEYSQLCFSKLADQKDAGMWNSMECKLIRWIVYCAAACEEYNEGFVTLENFLQSTKTPLTLEDRSDLEGCLAYLAIKDGRCDNAHELSEKVLSCDPMNVTAVNVKGMCEMQQGHFDVAINCFTKIIPEFKKEKAPQAKYYLGEIYNNLAICEAKLGRKNEADEHFRAAFNCNYPNVDVLNFSKIAIGPLGIQNQESNSGATLKPSQNSN